LCLFSKEKRHHRAPFLSKRQGSQYTSESCGQLGRPPKKGGGFLSMAAFLALLRALFWTK
jgi:hypothetical protein